MTAHQVETLTTLGIAFWAILTLVLFIGGSLEFRMYRDQGKEIQARRAARMAVLAPVWPIVSAIILLWFLVDGIWQAVTSLPSTLHAATRR